MYNAWLDSEQHAEMNGGDYAEARHEVGASFKAHGEYIWGRNVELFPNKKIVQSWRTNEFRESDPDSIIEVVFNEKNGKTKIIFTHKNAPEEKYNPDDRILFHADEKIL